MEGMPSRVPETHSKVSDFQVRRPDTLQFQSVEGLTRMAGVSEYLLRRLILKEVVDNSLDEMDRVGGDAGSVTVRRVGDDTYIVADEGGGIDQNPNVLRDLFSTNRPMVSGKVLRKPSRGTLGNGLRVLVGAVALSDGTIIVESHGQRTTLRPQSRGVTGIVEQTPVPRRLGTKITFTLDEIIPRDDLDLMDAEAAINLARASGPPYTRLPSPRWLDLDYLAEVFAVIDPDSITVRQLIEGLDGCSGAKAGKIAASFGKGRTCRSMHEPEIAALLRQMQSARVVKPKSLGPIGDSAFGEAFDGYIVVETELDHGAHEPRARIPVLIEAWASVNSRRGGEATLEVYCNRTPMVGGANAVRGQGGIRISGAGLKYDGAMMEVDGGDCDLIVAVTSPFIPTTSLGKAPDLSLLQPDIVEALRRVFVKSRNRLPPDPAQPKPPKSESPPKKPKPEPYQASGPLAKLLAKEAEEAGESPLDLLVLSPRYDPFNETETSRRDAEWFAKQVKRFLPEDRNVHLRGMYYRCLAAGNVLLPDGTPFEGTAAKAKLIETAGKAARWLGLVAFERIIDERSAPPEIYVPKERQDDATDDPISRELIVSDGRESLDEPLGVPELDLLLPTLSISHPKLPRQPFRICMIGEKVSLGEVLRPIAEEVQGELLLTTGEPSEAAVFGIASRAAADGRPLVILYFVDFDPSGWQMPISVARKLQAHICRQFHDLDVRVIRVALTLEHVIEFELPDSPMKSGEKRKDAWFKRWGRNQVEIDALAALRPEVLDQIARNAVAPYFDWTFESRYAEAMEMPEEHLDWFLDQPVYRKAKAFVGKVYKLAVREMAALNAAISSAVDAMRHVVENEAPDLSDVVVAPEFGDDEPEEAVFDSSDKFVPATQKLQNLKALSAEDDDDSEDQEGEDDDG